MTIHDYYAILGVPEHASDTEIRRAYRVRVRQYHPDVNPDMPMANERLQQVNAAGAVLGNPERRRAYDRARTIEMQRAQLGGFDTTGEQGYAAEYPISITRAEAHAGTQRSLVFHDRHGNPVTIVITIPAGTTPGTVFRYAGQGGPNRAGTQRGDLFVRVVVTADQSYADAQVGAVAARMARPGRRGLVGWIAAWFGKS